MSKRFVFALACVLCLAVGRPVRAGPIPAGLIKKLTGVIAATAPTTQPAAVAVVAEVAPLPRLSDTTLGQLLQGKKTLTAGEAVQVKFWLAATKDLLLTTLGFLPRLIVALVVFALFYGLYRAVRRLVMGGVGKAHVDSSVRDLLASALKWGIVGCGFIAACNQVGIQIGGILAGTAIIGLAIGFAAQETLANFIACLVIFWDAPFKVGDWIDADGRYGRVTRITFRSTRLINGDGEVIVIPNTMMLATKLANRSTNDLCRVKVPIHVSYASSIDDVREALLSLTRADERIAAEPAPSVWVAQCADHAVHVALGFWIADESKQKSMEAEFLEKAMKAFAGVGIEIPVPRMVVEYADAPRMRRRAA